MGSRTVARNGASCSDPLDVAWNIAVGYTHELSTNTSIKFIDSRFVCMTSHSTLRMKVNEYP